MGINISRYPYGKDPVIRTYIASSTWTKPIDANFFGVFVGCIGAGAGGSSGAIGTASLAQRPADGSGGGAIIWSFIPSNQLSSSITVTVGSGGSGGSVSNNSVQQGVRGGAGGTTSFSFYVTASGSPLQTNVPDNSNSTGGQVSFTGGYLQSSFPRNFPNGMGGTPGGGIVGAGGGAGSNGRDGGTDSFGTASGGSGAVISGSITYNGTRGGRMYNLGVISTTPSGGLGNTAETGSNGIYSYNTNWFMDPTVELPLGPGSGGGGGGAGDLGGTIGGGKGGDGGIGAGGGNGGSCRSGSRSGNGGRGGDGICVVIEIYG